MGRFFAIFTLLLATGQLLAATNDPPVKLAIVPESPAAATVADLLTAEFTKNDTVQLLERSEIERVYRELKSSAANRDDLKLGQLLGADGLLLVESIEATPKFKTNIPFARDNPRTVSVRLIAVKPGVVLAAEKFSLSSENLGDWSSSLVKQLGLYLPKLNVLAKNAIPVSLINLRSAVASAEAAETERELKALTVRRLSREPQLFVLEREQMQSLTAEKDLQADESAFWNGSYLLEGVVDQNGYSKDIVTIDARLTPPKGGQPLSLAVTGSRTNLAEVVNQLAVKVAEALKITTLGKEWQAADEAAKYFSEAQWALRWGVMPEAQAAVESSWALGKKDLACGQMRVSVYLDTLPAVLSPKMQVFKHTPGYHFVHLDEPPDPRDCDSAIRALENYVGFSRQSRDGELRFFSRPRSEWRQSDWDWYQLGIDVLQSSSDTLRHYYFFPDAQPPVAEKLADMRALARSVAALISQVPSVHDTYYCAPDHLVSAEEFDPKFLVWVGEGRMRFSQEQSPNIFRCAIKWGCFWQERPEDAIELYRGLMAGPLFHRLHGDLWVRERGFPRLAAWNAQDQNSIPTVWRRFVDALKGSTNAFDRFEGLALDCADARAKVWAGHDPNVAGSAEAVDADEGWQASRAALVDFIATNYESIVKNNGNLAGNGWGMTVLLGGKSASLAKFAAIQEAYNTNFSDHPKESASREQPAKAIPVRAPASVANASSEIATNVVLVNKFLAIPTDELPAGSNATVTITAHHWAEGKLLLDFQYGAYLAQFKGTNWQSTRNLTLAGIAILDPAAERWQVIPCPEVEVINHNRFYHRTTLFQGRVFTSYEGQIRRFDVPTRRWQKIALPDLGNCELFALNDHLYAATENLMVEILDDGVRAQILASNRRQPPASALDTEELGTPILFAGPDRSLRAAIGNKIAAWNGSDWRTVCPAPDTIIPPAISQDGLLFMAAGQRGWSSIWHLAMAGDEMELYLGASSGVEHPGPQAQPVWKLPSDIHSPALPAASRNGNLYLLVDHAKSEPIVDDQSKVNVGQRVVPQNGYHAQLLCFARHLGTPQMIPLNFAAPNADAPVYGGRPAGGFMMPVVPSAWLSFSSNWLCLARETPDAIPNANGGGNRRAGQPKAGIWMVALAEIDAEFARQQAAQQEQQAHAESLDRQSASDLLAKYDRNHNGIIDPDEREEALDDPAFIKTHLDEIDANHNGWLDAPELAWFDANQNKELDPKERTGIDLAEQYLAEKLLNQSDRDGNRWLTPVPYDAMIHDSLHESSAAEFDLQFAHVDINHDNRIDLDELKNLMRQRLQGQLSRNVRRNPHEFGGAQPPGFHPMGLRPRQPVNPAQKFKSAVEAYWQNQAGANNP